MKNTKTTKTQNTMDSFNILVNSILDSYDLTEMQMAEFDSLTENNDLDGLKAFNSRLEKLQAIEMPEKTKAIKLADLTFDAVSVGGVFRFHYTKKAVSAMLKNNIVCDIAFTDNSIQADTMPEYDDAIITAITDDSITAISKNSGVEYTLINDDFNGIINGVQHATYKNCMFGVLPFTYKAPATATA